MSPEDKLAAFCEGLDSSTLVAAMLELDGQAGIEQGIARRQMFATLEDRHPEAEALMEKMFSDESEAGQMILNSHTYAELLMMALDKSGAVSPA